MDGEQPFLARDDDERLVFFSFTALLDVIKNVGWMVCVHLNECWRIAFPFRYVADNLPVMLLPQIQPKIASRSVPLSRKSKSLQRSVQSLNSQRTLESSRPFPMLLMQQTRVIYLIYHRNCPELPKKSSLTHFSVNPDHFLQWYFWQKRAFVFFPLTLNLGKHNHKSWQSNVFTGTDE